MWTGAEDGTACAVGTGVEAGAAGNQAGCVGATGLPAMARAAGLRLGAMGVIGAFMGVLKGAFTGELGALVNCGLKGVDSGALLGAGRAAALT